MVDVHRDRVELAIDGHRQQGERVGASRAAHHDGGSDVVEADDAIGDADERAEPRATRRSLPTTQAAGGGSRRSTRSSQRVGVSSSARVGRLSESRHAGSSPCGPASRSTAATNASPTSYWRIFDSNPSSFESAARHAPTAAPRLQDARHALLSGDVLASELVHHAVAVTLEHRHQRLHLRDRAPVLGRRDQRDDPAVVERVASPPKLVGGPDERADDLARIGVDAAEHPLHEREEVVVHPRDAEELRPVRDLVDRDPEPEVARRNANRFSSARTFGTDVVHRVAVGPAVDTVVVVVIGDEHVVLTEDTLGEPAEQHAELGRAHGPPDGCERAARHALPDAARERAEEPAHRPDVGFDPVVTVEHRGTRGARHVQTGVLADERLGLRRDRVEVLDERRREVRGGQGVVAGDATGDSRRKRPVDRLWWRDGRIGGRRGSRHSTRLPRYLGMRTLRTYPTDEHHDDREEAERQDRCDPVEPLVLRVGEGAHGARILRLKFWRVRFWRTRNVTGRCSSRRIIRSVSPVGWLVRLAVGVLVERHAERLGDPALELGRDLVATAGRDHLPHSSSKS